MEQPVPRCGRGDLLVIVFFAGKSPLPIAFFVFFNARESGLIL